MKLYRVAKHDDINGSTGYCWHSNLRDAKKALKTFIRESTAHHHHSMAFTGMMDHMAEPKSNPMTFAFAGIEEVEIKTTKLGILKFLDKYAGYPNNG